MFQFFGIKKKITENPKNEIMACTISFFPGGLIFYFVSVKIITIIKKEVF